MLGMGGPRTIVGLDVGSWSVKAVALQSVKGRLSLQGYAILPIGDQEPAAVIRKAIEQLGGSRRELVSSVSGRSVIVRMVQTPRLSQDDLKRHIAYEADKYIPFSADEVVIDCQIMSDAVDEKAEAMQVLLVAVRQGFVEDHINLLGGVGLRPDVIDVDVFAVCNAFWALGPVLDSSSEGAVALVDIGASKTWVAIVKGDKPLFQREIYLAGNEVSEAIGRTFNEQDADIEALKLNPGAELDAVIDAAMPAFEDLANEIRLSFDYVEGQFDQAVKRVVLSGGSSLLPRVPEILGNILGREVHVFDPLAGLDLIPSRYDLHNLEANGPGLTVALGLACHLAAEGIVGLGGTQIASWRPGKTGSGPQPAGLRGGPGVSEQVATETVPREPTPARQQPLPPFTMNDPSSGIATPRVSPVTRPKPEPTTANIPSPYPAPPTAMPFVSRRSGDLQPPTITVPQRQDQGVEPGIAQPVSRIRTPMPKSESIANRDSILVVLDDDEAQPPETGSIGRSLAGDEGDEHGLPPLPGEER